MKKVVLGVVFALTFGGAAFAASCCNNGPCCELQMPCCD
jgi:hypothetical protein